MLGTFSKGIFQAVTFQGYFPKWQLSKSILAAVIGPQAHPSYNARPPWYDL